MVLWCYTYAVNCGYCTHARTRTRSYCTRNIPAINHRFRTEYSTQLNSTQLKFNKNDSLRQAERLKEIYNETYMTITLNTLKRTSTKYLYKNP